MGEPARVLLRLLPILIVGFLTFFLLSLLTSNTAAKESVKGANKVERVEPITIKATIKASKPQPQPKPVATTVVATPYTQPKVTFQGNTIWDKLANCESGGINGPRWDYNGPSGYDGGLQFLPSTWTSMNTGYTYAWQAPRSVQIATAIKLQAQSGWGQWPNCARQLGLI